MALLEQRLGHAFAKRALLERALTHGSRANEEGDPGASNERLEFLGDAVLDLVVSELLMEARPAADEGELSRARADLVNTQALAAQARALGLDRYVRLSAGEQRAAGSAKPSILANVFESVLGALYLDAGLAPARALVARLLEGSLAPAAGTPADPKTRLQELLHARGLSPPSYRTTGASGPDHAREFQVEVWVAGELYGSGSGPSKREAEKRAARQALERLEGSVQAGAGVDEAS